MSHCHFLHGFRISFWRDAVSAERDVATSVHVVPIGKQYPEFKFDLPEQRQEFEKLQSLMLIVASSADFDARLEIRNALGVSK